MLETASNTMEDLRSVEYHPVTILDVLEVDLCARAILEHVSVAELVRSERVSRRWQRVVGQYLRTCGTLRFDGSRSSNPWDTLDTVFNRNHQTISIHKYTDFLPLVCKTLDKWGPFITTVITDIGEKDYLAIILSRCSNAKELEISRSRDDIEMKRWPRLNPIKKLKNLKHIVLQNIFGCMRTENFTDSAFSKLFQAINCETITIRVTSDLTGSFLRSIKCNNLKSLRLEECELLKVAHLISAIDKIRNLTSLELDEGLDDASKIHVLLLEMPYLEKVSLSSFTFYDEWVEVFSGLSNLKRLTIHATPVTDDFLEGLARGCKMLEYLNVNCTKLISARGVTALCRRSPSARTTLHFPNIYDVEEFDQVWFENQLSRYFKKDHLYKGLAALGCVDLTLEWFVAACRDPRGRELPLNPSAGCPADELKNLKLILFSY